MAKVLGSIFLVVEQPFSKYIDRYTHNVPHSFSLSLFPCLLSSSPPYTLCVLHTTLGLGVPAGTMLGDRLRGLTAALCARPPDSRLSVVWGKRVNKTNGLTMHLRTLALCPLLFSLFLSPRRFIYLVTSLSSFVCSFVLPIYVYFNYM